MDDWDLSMECASRKNRRKKSFKLWNNPQLYVACTYIINPSCRRSHAHAVVSERSVFPHALPAAADGGARKRTGVRNHLIFCTIAVKLNAAIKKRKRAPTAAAEYLYKHISHMDSAGVCSGVGGFDIHSLQRECKVAAENWKSENWVGAASIQAFKRARRRRLTSLVTYTLVFFQPLSATE